MHMLCGTWAQLGLPYGGTSEFDPSDERQLANNNSFLVKDAQEDLQSRRLKA